MIDPEGGGGRTSASWSPDSVDWTTPGAHAVAPGVHRISVPIPDPALKAVNIYVVESHGGPFLVDGGWVGEEPQRTLAEGLAELGHELGDVTDVYVTHSHYDHYTLAVSLRAQFGCRVWLGREERHTVAAGLEPDGPIGQGAMLQRCGAPDWVEEFVTELRGQELSGDGAWAEPDGWLDDGDTIPAGRGHHLSVLTTPGHTRGHVVLHDPGRGVLFSGDHVLPHITPSVGFERAPAEQPVHHFLASLRRVRQLPDTLLLPAHGPVTASTHRRVDELLAHHRDRLTSALDCVGRGATTARDVAELLPWTSSQRPLSALPLVHRGLAVLEIGAHLDLLVERQVLRTTDDGGVRHYALRTPNESQAERRIAEHGERTP